MAIVGEAWILLRPTDAGFEAQVFKDVEKAMLAVNAKVPKLKPEADVSKATGPLDLLKSKLSSFAGKNPMTSALKDVETASGGASGALSGLATGGIAIAAAAITAFAIKGVADFMDLTAQARQLQRVTGASAEDSSRLAAAFRAVGIEVSTAAVSIGRFERNIATSEPKLNALGITIARTAKGTVDMKETILNLSDTISKTEDPTTRANIAIAALGRSGLNMLPVLQRGREGVLELFKEADKTHTLFNKDDLQTGLDLSLAIKNVKESITGAFSMAGKAVAPFVLDIIKLIQGVGDLGDKFSWLGTTFGVIWQGISAPFEAIAGLLHATVLGIDAMTGKTHDLGVAASVATAEQTRLAEQTKAVNAALDAEAKAIDALKGVFENVVTAQRADVTANEAVVAARTKVSEATVRLNDLLAKGTVNTGKLESAQAALVTASDNLATAQDKELSTLAAIEDAHLRQIDAITALTDAQQAYDDLISGKTAAKDLAGHQHDLEKANLAVRTSTLAQHDAQKNLDKVQSSGLATADELAAAQLKLDEANLALTTSQEAVGTTQAALTAIQDEGKTGSDKLEAATKTLDSAHRTLDTTTRALEKTYKDHVIAQDAVVDAGQRIIDKQALVDKALLPDPVLVTAIVAARQTVATETLAVKTALEGASGAAGTWGEKQIALNQTLETKSVPDLQAVKDKIQAIINLHPEAAASYAPLIALIDSKIADLKAQLIASPVPIGGPRFQIGAGAGPSPADLLGQMAGPGNETFVGGGQSGAYLTGSFWTGEAGRPELVSLRPGGGAMVYTAEGARAVSGAGGLTIHAPIEANFYGPTNADDVVAAIRGIAENEMAGTILRVIDRARAGAR